MVLQIGTDEGGAGTFRQLTQFLRPDPILLGSQGNKVGTHQVVHFDNQFRLFPGQLPLAGEIVPGIDDQKVLFTHFSAQLVKGILLPGKTTRLAAVSATGGNVAVQIATVHNT